jgi:FixJ family two-component response regulator
MRTGKQPSRTEPALLVYVVDDDADVRHALGLLLKLRGYEVELCDCAEAFLRGFPDDASGCLVTDIRMPGMSGLELQQELASRSAHIPVVVLTAHGDVASARTALKAQAVDFLLKPFKEQDLLAAIETAFARERARIEARTRSSADRAMLAALTTREREVAALLATGAQNLEIADRLGISPRTVEIHKARCMEKLRARSIADIVRFADRAGLRPCS